MILSDPLHFGKDANNPECALNETVKIYFYWKPGHSVKLVDPVGLTWLRIMAGFIGAAVGLILFKEVQLVAVACVVVWSRVIRGVEKQEDMDHDGRNERDNMDDLENRKDRFFRTIGTAMMLAGPLSIIVVIEMTLSVNNYDKESRSWTYGQITALAIALYQAVASICQSEPANWIAKSVKKILQKRYGHYDAGRPLIKGDEERIGQPIQVYAPAFGVPGPSRYSTRGEHGPRVPEVTYHPTLTAEYRPFEAVKRGKCT
ncbi:unnamed protein product [Rhizoctonia solani]|uniref:Uncharacterized protein n=1 Tax=Rhizoctonia solani TaxID=456999 RepID=A0A8H2W9C9_9AGAM|nr:unnamed protein product [Rhizoctonia solani]